MKELDASPYFAGLMSEYADEAAIKDLPRPETKLAVYYGLEESGALHVLSATVDDRLVGFIFVLAVRLPHYDRLVGVVESFFVSKEHRTSLAGLKLLNAAENRAANLGCHGLLIEAPLHSSLFYVLSRAGYAESSRTFFKELNQCQK